MERQHAAIVTMNLLQRWLQGQDGLTVSEISYEVGMDYRGIWDLMQNLFDLPYLSCQNGRFVISLDCPIWRFCQLPLETYGAYKHASLVVYLIAYTTLLGTGITTLQLAQALKMTPRSIRYIIDGMSSEILVWKDGQRWMILPTCLENCTK